VVSEAESLLAEQPPAKAGVAIRNVAQRKAEMRSIGEWSSFLILDRRST